MFKPSTVVTALWHMDSNVICPSSPNEVWPHAPCVGCTATPYFRPLGALFLQRRYHPFYTSKSPSRHSNFDICAPKSATSTPYFQNRNLGTSPPYWTIVDTSTPSIERNTHWPPLTAFNGGICGFPV